MDVQIVIDLFFDKVAHIFINAFTAGTHCQRTEFDFCLTFKHRLFHVNGNGCHNTIADIRVFVIFAEKLFYRFGDMLFKGTLMRSSLCCMLSVHKRVILFAILIGMSKRNFDVFSLHVNDGIKAIVGHIII